MELYVDQRLGITALKSHYASSFVQNLLAKTARSLQNVLEVAIQRCLISKSIFPAPLQYQPFCLNLVSFLRKICQINDVNRLRL